MKKLLPKAALHFVLLIGVVLIAIPVYLTFVNVFKTSLEAAESYMSLPKSFNLDNLKTLFAMPAVWPAIWNSVVITLMATAIIAVLVPMAAYPISRNFNRFYYRFIFYLFISGMFVPLQMLMLPTVKFMSWLHLSNPAGLILIYLTASLIQGVFLCIGYLRTVPFELEEAAEIDGAGTWTIFFKVIYPIMRPIAATVVIINALWIWNEFMLPLILLNKDPSSWTLPLFQYNLRERTDLGTTVQFVAYSLSVFPILIFYIFAQKHIISGLTEGSLKG